MIVSTRTVCAWGALGHATAAYDAAIVSMDLALLYLRQRRTAELKTLAKEMLPIFRSQDVHREAVAALVDEREVTDSGGHRTRRAFLRTRLSLAGVDREVEVNLAERRGMRFPMLLGRTALAGVFTVDPAGSYLVSGAPE